MKLELQNNDDDDVENNDYPDPLKEGEEVVIINPKRGQGTTGVLIKIHQRTKRATVLTTNRRGREEKVVRLITNIRRSGNDDR